MTPPLLRRLLVLIAPTVGLPQPGRGASEPAVPPSRPGNLIIVGGRDTPMAVQQRFVSLAGGAGRTRIALFPMASTQFDEEAREVMADLRKLNADTHLINLDRQEAQAEATAQRLETFTGYWFLGGDQNRLAATLLGTRALDVIERRYQEGAVVGGTSAGAAVMTSEMLTGREKPDKGEAPLIARGAIDLARGFGFLPEAIIDQHLLKRARYNRLLSAVLDRPQLVGIGIDEETALQVRPDGRWEVLGNSYVKIIDARGARLTHDRRQHPAAPAAAGQRARPEAGARHPARGRLRPARRPTRAAQGWDQGRIWMPQPKPPYGAKRGWG